MEYLTVTMSTYNTSLFGPLKEFSPLLLYKIYTFVCSTHKFSICKVFFLNSSKSFWWNLTNTYPLIFPVVPMSHILGKQSCNWLHSTQSIPFYEVLHCISSLSPFWNSIICSSIPKASLNHLLFISEQKNFCLDSLFIFLLFSIRSGHKAIVHFQHHDNQSKYSRFF